MNPPILRPPSARDILDAAKSSEHHISIRPRRILLADDDEIILNYLSTVLAEAGFDVSLAADGQEAWEALLNQDYDLLVTDKEMPRLGGIELIERIRDANMSLPVIIISGNLSEEGARDYPQLQIHAVISKPFSTSAFLDMVTNALQACSGETNDGAGTVHQTHPYLQPVL